MNQRKRKEERAIRRVTGEHGYRNKCWHLINFLREAKAAPEEFRAELKRERHRFAAYLAGRQG
jgi:hypothetical protein